MADRPLPDPDPDTAGFWAGCANHKLLVQACSGCGSLRWPPQAFCPGCHLAGHTYVALPGTGVVSSYVIVFRAFHPAFELHVPYIIAHVTIAATGGPVTIVSNVVDCDIADIRVGLEVEVVFIHVSGSSVLPMFRAAGQRHAARKENPNARPA